MKPSTMNNALALAELRRAGWTISEDGAVAYSPWFTPPPPPATRKTVEQERDELRAILAPILDAPQIEIGLDRDLACIFCAAALARRQPHDSDCPVSRKDALLGRTT